MPSRSNSCSSWLRPGIWRGEQAVAVEDRIGTGQEAQCLHGITHVGAARGKSDVRLRHQQPCRRNHAHEVERVEFRQAVQRCARHLHQLVDRHALRMLLQSCKRVQQRDAIGFGFTHAEDAATADVESGITDGLQCIEAILVGAGRDDLAVELFRGVEIVVVVVESRVLQLQRLLRCQHAERGAGLETECANLAHHQLDLLQLVRLRVAVGGAHAEACRAVGLGCLCPLHHVADLHELLPLEASVVAHALRAVRAILRARARLDRDQGTHLHLVRHEMVAMHALGVKQQVAERRGVDRARLLERPVGADGAEQAEVGGGHGMNLVEVSI